MNSFATKIWTRKTSLLPPSRPINAISSAGPTKSFEWHGYEIRQFPGYVVFLFDSGNRVIHLDAKPHPPANLKLWNGDSRGH